MEYRLAKGLEKLRDQVNKKWPTRSKDSDGWIGDTSHAARHSDHNPDSSGVVHAIDITHDPAHGFNSYDFADAMLKAQDPRLSYVISNRRIGSGPAGPAPGTWRHYGGANPHDHHVHISIRDGKFADDNRDWDFGLVKETPVDPNWKPPRPTLRLDSKGDDVKYLQVRLGQLMVDGIYGPKTVARVKRLQAQRGLVEDGICGPATWAVIEE